MFQSKSLIEFGESVKQIRVTLGYSRYKVNEMTGIKRDTIRNLENGSRVPRYDTLDQLSKIYKINLHLLFEKKRASHDIYELYQYMDSMLLSYSIDSMTKISDMYEQITELNKNVELISAEDLKLFELFIHLVKNFYDENFSSYDEFIQKIIKALKVKNINEVCSDKKKYFNFIEMRILIILSSYLMRINNHEEAIMILETVSPKIEESILNEINKYQIKIRVLLNLSYLNNITMNFVASMNYAVKGIELSHTMNSTYLLPELYGRLAVSKIQLKYEAPSYDEDIRNCLNLFKLKNNMKLYKIYIDIFERDYKIKIQDKFLNSLTITIQ